METEFIIQISGWLLLFKSVILCSNSSAIFAFIILSHLSFKLQCFDLILTTVKEQDSASSRKHMSFFSHSFATVKVVSYLNRF